MNSFEEASLITETPVLPSRSFRLVRTVAAVLAPIACTALLTLPGDRSVSGEAAMGCINPTEQDIDDVEALLAAPTDPYINDRIVRGWDEQAASEFTGDFTEQAIVDVNAHTAEQLDLTTHDYLEYSRPLRHISYNEETETTDLPFEGYFDLAHEFASMYGIELMVGLDEGVYADTENERDPTPEELETLSSKQNMRNLIENLGTIPVEYLELAGLHKIVLYYGDNGYAGYVQPEIHPGTYFVNVTSNQQRHVMSHELYHLIDYEQCGYYGSYNDPALRALNQGHQYLEDGITTDEVATYDDLSRLSDAHRQAFDDAVESGDKDTYCGLLDESYALAEEVISVSDYGSTNPLEDKAEIFSDMLDAQLTEGGVFIEDFAPIVRDKSVFLLARLYAQNPALAEYFTRISAPIDFGEGDGAVYQPPFECN